MKMSKEIKEDLDSIQQMCTMAAEAMGYEITQSGVSKDGYMIVHGRVTHKDGSVLPCGWDPLNDDEESDELKQKFQLKIMGVNDRILCILPIGTRLATGKLSVSISATKNAARDSRFIILKAVSEIVKAKHQFI